MKDTSTYFDSQESTFAEPPSKGRAIIAILLLGAAATSASVVIGLLIWLLR